MAIWPVPPTPFISVGAHRPSYCRYLLFDGYLAGPPTPFISVGAHRPSYCRYLLFDGYLAGPPTPLLGRTETEMSVHHNRKSISRDPKISANINDLNRNSVPDA